MKSKAWEIIGRILKVQEIAGRKVTGEEIPEIRDLLFEIGSLERDVVHARELVVELIKEIEENSNAEYCPLSGSRQLEIGLLIEHWKKIEGL